MVAKINIGSSLFGALSYNQEKVDAGEAKVLCSNKVLLPTDKSLTLAFCMRSFENHLPKDIKTEKHVVHISLNPHPDDNLSDEQLSAIAQEYLDKMGYGNQPFVVYKHEDIDRHHIHIVSLRVDENGKKINDKFEYRRSKEITRELEQKYGLHPADKQSRCKTPQLPKVDYKNGNIKKQIANLTKELAGSYRFQSIGEYKTLLSLYNIGLEEVKGEFEGKPHHGIVYFALDKKGRKKGLPVKASLIGKQVGAENLKKRCGYNAQNIKKNKLTEATRTIIDSAMAISKTRGQFTQQLQKHGIDLVFRENQGGRIYGVTFIDHNQHTALNGSRYGKAFSANALNEKFGQDTTKNTPGENSEIRDNEKEPANGIFSFIDFTGQGENYEEEAFIRKMKRKRKRK
ncbi:Relaxase/Mobilisation nuclease domain-containing protein [Tangfeifania diversioriginum]|uniref:Relaxase/Mobilisation nuclease domain-containing protein n=1 Tax=Tangfeifania diversioriginum TaxID=1168035 RepID=A0A1M6MRH1_9BACT|nr:conjugal transfer protein MobB [Tangfeifania diversioriginum]SHJ85980.1 Relaxase/Mobilisation nuclease domain-containing protein [Tangfeifania diversioriginum]